MYRHLIVFLGRTAELAKFLDSAEYSEENNLPKKGSLNVNTVDCTVFGTHMYSGYNLNGQFIFNKTAVWRAIVKTKNNIYKKDENILK
jgi:hypothetical protein